MSRKENSQLPTKESQSRAKRVNNQETKRKVEFIPELVTEVQTRPKFDNEKALSQPKEEEIQNQRVAKRCSHLSQVIFEPCLLSK